MTAACLSGVFRIHGDAEVRSLPNGDPVVTLALAYHYGTRPTSGGRPFQIVEGGLWGTRATKLAPKLLDRCMVFAVIEDVHIETYFTAAGVAGYKLAGRVGRIEIVSGPPQTAADQPQRADAACRLS
jgi:single-strand DNA-binding protein